MSFKTKIDTRELFIKVSKLSISTKNVHSSKNLLSSLVTETVMKLVSKSSTFIEIRNINLFKCIGGSIEDTEIIDGVIIDRKKSGERSSTTYCVDSPLICLAQFRIVPFSVSKILPEDRDKLRKQKKSKRDKADIHKFVSKLKTAGCNVLIIQKSYITEEITTFGEALIESNGFRLIKGIPSEEIDSICRFSGKPPIASISSITPSNLLKAECVESIILPKSDERVVRITGIQGQSRASSIIIRGSCSEIVEEVERTIRDAICNLRTLLRDDTLVPGGGAGDIELYSHIKRINNKRHKLINSLISSILEVPSILVKNAGGDPINIIHELIKLHTNGNKRVGIEGKSGKIADMVDLDIIQPILTLKSYVRLAGHYAAIAIKLH